MTSRVLVTGGAGFIGSHLVRRLGSLGHEAHVLYRPGGDTRRIEDMQHAIGLWDCDLLDADSVVAVIRSVRPQVIYHLAGDASLRHLDSELSGVKESIDRNIHTSMNLLVAAHRHADDCRLLVRLGGLEEYGSGPLPYQETQRELPVSPYSASQVAVTHYMQMLAPHLGFRTLTVRPALIYGPAQSTSFFIPALINNCLESRDFAISPEPRGRDLLYIDDLVDALVRVLEVSLPSGDIINIGSGREYFMAEVGAMVIRLAGAGIRLVDGNSKRPGDLEHLFCDRRKAEQLLEWSPKVDLAEGLLRTIEFYRLQFKHNESS